jgi:hypothetical protein
MNADGDKQTSTRYFILKIMLSLSENWNSGIPSWRAYHVVKAAANKHPPFLQRAICLGSIA